MPRRAGKARHKRPAKDRADMDNWQLRQAPQQEAGPDQAGVAYVLEGLVHAPRVRTACMLLLFRLCRVSSLEMMPKTDCD